AKAFLALAQQNMTDYDHVLSVSRDRLQSGDIAQVDLDRLQLQRVQYESDFAEPRQSLAELRQVALATRPDLLAARQSIDKANVDYRLAVANGSTDPDIGATVAWQPQADGNGPENVSVGVGVSIPLRLFDRNQGEKAKTKIDI